MASDRILTTHVGSLIRPPELQALLMAKERGVPVDAKAHAALLDRLTQEVVREQAKIGIDIIDDGEFRKEDGWSRYVLERLANLRRFDKPFDNTVAAPSVQGRDRKEFAEFYRVYDASVRTPIRYNYSVVGPISYAGQKVIKREIADFKKALKGVKYTEGFMTAVASTSVLPERDDKYYKRAEDCTLAISDALHDEYKAIIDAGFILQIDDAFLAHNFDFFNLSPKEYCKWAEGQAEIINHGLRGLPQDRIRYHVCWGSWNGPHVHDVGVKDILPAILKVNAGGYSLEMANPRHEHEWRVWEDVKLPEGKTLLPGVISHATNVVEHPDLVAERIVRLARLVGRENIIASTDCGFAQSQYLERVHVSLQWAKLKSLVEGARRATKQLWAKGGKKKAA